MITHGRKGIAKVTFDWICADQSDSTTQILGSNTRVVRGSVTLFKGTACGCLDQLVLKLDELLFDMVLHLKWSLRAIMDEIDKAIDDAFRKLGHSFVKREQRAADRCVCFDYS